MKRIEINHKQIFTSRVDRLLICLKEELNSFVNYENNKELIEEDAVVYIDAIVKSICNDYSNVLYDLLYKTGVEEFRMKKELENQLSLL